MKIRQTIVASAITAIVGIAGAQGAQAQALKIGDHVTVTDVEVTGNDPVTVADPIANDGPENTYAAAIIFTINGQQVVVNCDDLWHNVGIGNGQSLGYTVAAFSGLSSSPNPGYSGVNYNATQISEMSWLIATSAKMFSTQQATTIGTDGITIASNYDQDLGALQLASWEIGNPNAVFTNDTNPIATLASEYKGYVTANDPALPTGYNVYQLVSSNGSQDQLFAEAVPEPATWAMFLVGFGAIGWTLRKSRSKGAVAATA